jgi:hypothetical protein
MSTSSEHISCIDLERGVCLARTVSFGTPRDQGAGHLVRHVDDNNESYLPTPLIAIKFFFVDLAPRSLIFFGTSAALDRQPS